MDNHANVLSLCSGGGGLDLGLRMAVPDARTVCYVENEATAILLLAARMEDQSLDTAPLWSDLKTFESEPWRGVVDWVIGGYPCQPFSSAGKQLGLEDPRHLWPYVANIVRVVQPRYCFFENVGAHLRTGAHEVFTELQAMGYRTAGVLLTAEEVGAPHKRERLFILAHSTNPIGGSGERREEAGVGTDGQRRWGLASSGAHMADASSIPRKVSSASQPDDTRGRTTAGASRVSDRPHVAFTRCSGRQGCEQCGTPDGEYGLEAPGSAPELCRPFPPRPTALGAWERILAVRPDLAPAIESPFRGVADGMAGELGRADQLHILGNGVVPQQAAYALGLLGEALN